MLVVVPGNHVRGDSASGIRTSVPARPRSNSCTSRALYGAAQPSLRTAMRSRSVPPRGSLPVLKEPSVRVNR